MRLRSIIILISLLLFVGFLGFQLEITLPGRPPSVNNTYTPITKSAPKGVGSYDVLGYVVSKEEANKFLQTEKGREALSAENGAVEITEELINLGRDAFYQETFGNEYLFTDIVGILDGPINLGSITKAILALKGKQTTNLQIPLDQDITVGDRTFPAGTVLNTGLDVPKGSLFPLGITLKINHAQPRVGITCALCHATVNQETGRILEGAINTDVNLGPLIAMASNSAALFRQTDVNPTKIPLGKHTYIDKNGETAFLPDSKIMEDEVDKAILSWPPGNFVSNGDLKNNSAQIPSSYTHDSWPYAWSGVASIGWFHGLTTLNNAVFGLNADPTTTADTSEEVLGIDKETYLGTMLQNASKSEFRLPEGAQPSEFLDKVDPTPGEPGINSTIRMPEYPKGSLFMQNGLMAVTPGLPVAAQLNGMSAWQNTLAPPPHEAADLATLQRGAKIFTQANCNDCHSGRYFTNHKVIPVQEVKTQGNRAPASQSFAEQFAPPDTYPSNVPVPLPSNPAVLSIPTDITPQEDIELAYAISDPAGGYKVQNLIGLYLSAPYLHDGGVAASREAFKQDEKGGFVVANSQQLGMAGTLMRGILPDAEASLRSLVDRNLREPMVAANKASSDLQRSNITGQGHPYWVDEQAGFTTQQQTDLINFLLSIDDDPAVLP
ncbi:di-heme oxidoredictase family protein [Chlorogloeopsis sp. ULAP01]|uniref:di-heme oxidoredictase family protein n=1 Tax=Chlorogloeopsis sp. ULAP01 TaxID=3056483 RepID=UPI0025AA70C3|nr:di-heme oxidoredictase family protein [Chlorogloeopsis sp. ULAP01]MDM9383150.1 di-heme oxidoredictase family protein [Chlorogloeopsis sp. ULAP01]